MQMLTLIRIIAVKNTQCGKEEDIKSKSQDSDWVELIINPNEEDSDDKENIETNIP